MCFYAGVLSPSLDRFNSFSLLTAPLNAHGVHALPVAGGGTVVMGAGMK
jgi:hypothetical protein